MVMTSKKFDSLFGGPPRPMESPITTREMDLARSIQVVTEEAVHSPTSRADYTSNPLPLRKAHCPRRVVNVGRNYARNISFRAY